MFTNDQSRVIEGHPGNTVVFASPGSGKTTVLTNHLLRQFELRTIRPETTLCLTFTQQAAHELESRLKRLAPSHLQKALGKLRVGTFHSQIFKTMMQIQPNIPVILSPIEQCRMVTAVLKRVGVSGRERTQEVLNEISRRKSGQQSAINNRLMKRIINDYERVKTLHHRWDFDDILLQFVHQLETDKDATVSKILPIEYLLVDEFQDTNTIQWDIMTRLRHHFHLSTFVVGDDDQSIYGFRGASPRWLLDFSQAVPNTKVHLLEDNFRSDKSIIEHACSVIRHNQTRTPKVIRVASDRLGESKYFEWKNEESEAIGVGSLIREANAGQTIAILARTRQQLQYVARRLYGLKITYSTYHQAKGREWDVVHMIGVIDNNPYLRRDRDADYEEERRLFYVAVTRARHSLFLHRPRHVKHLKSRLCSFTVEGGFTR